MSHAYEKSPFNYFIGARTAYVEAGFQRASVNLRRIQFPAAYILSGDVNFPFDVLDADPDNYFQDTLFSFIFPAHNKRVNVLFGDLHVGTSENYFSELGGGSVFGVEGFIPAPSVGVFLTVDPLSIP